MHGWMLTIQTHGKQTLKEFRKPPSLAEIKAELEGGFLELIPYFTEFTVKGTQAACIAYCDEEGKIKRLPRNPVAQTLWEKACRRTITEDLLVGPVVILWGDIEFMRSM